MLIRRTHKQKTPSRLTPHRRKIVVALLLVLIFIASTGILAQVFTQKKSKKPPADFTAATVATKLSKEYVYAGSKLAATVEPTASPNGDDAEVVSMCVIVGATCVTNFENGSAFGVPGQEYLVEIIMKNTGATPWTIADYKLGSQNPANNTTWGAGKDRITLPNSVSPGSPVTFRFSTAKPANPTTGYFNFQWQMVRDTGGVGFFGEKTRNVLITAGTWLPGGSPDAASFVSQTTPAFMFAGQNYPVSITMNNSGSNTWTAANNYKLGSQAPQDNQYWGTTRVNLPASVAPGANATFAFTANAPSTTGKYNFQWMMVQDGGVGFFGTLSQPIAMTVTSRAALGYQDYNLDGKTDLGFWRPSLRRWTINTNLGGAGLSPNYTFGSTGDLPIPGDYNGDGQADLVTLSLSSFLWAFDFNRDGTADQTVTFGATNDIPAPQDYNGDKQADLAVFRPSTGQWLIDQDRNGTADITATFGQSGDIPVPADYDGDGEADLAVFRPSNHTWYIDTNHDGTADITVALGQSSDLPVPTDANGDGKADLTLFRPSTGQWLIDTNLDGTADITITVGQSGDIPVAGDYDGDGKTDVAVFRPSNHTWYIDTNRDGTADYTINFGASTDIPLRQNGWILKAMGLLPQ
jgi:hypothetical protein